MLMIDCNEVHYSLYIIPLSTYLPKKKGLGNMGSPMCNNLLKRTDIVHSVVAYDTNASSLQRMTDSGAIPLRSLSDLPNYDIDVVITMLPDGPIVSNVIDKLLSALRNSTSSTTMGKSKEITFIDCSTIGPALCKDLHSKVTESLKNSRHSKLSMLDAPVSGGVNGAIHATLTFMVGGTKETLHKVQPVLSCMGKNIIHCGPSSMGIVAKLANNLALATQMIGICEAMNLGTSLGMDPIVLSKVMNASTAKCWSSEVNNPHPDVAAATTQSAASKNYDGGFGSSLMLKDVSLAVQAGDAAKVALPLGSLAKELYSMVDLTGNGKKDFGVMMQFLRGNLSKGEDTKNSQ